MKGKNNIVIVAVVVLLVGAIAFFAGMQYQKGQRGSFAGRNGGPGNFKGKQGGMQGVRPITGEIISQDDNSITVKMQDGSTKIVILSDQTTINKASTGTKSDLKSGEQVAAFGTENSDGSVTAQNVSIGGMFRGMGGRRGGGKNQQPSNNQ